MSSIDSCVFKATTKNGANVSRGRPPAMDPFDRFGRNQHTGRVRCNFSASCSWSLFREINLRTRQRLSVTNSYLKRTRFRRVEISWYRWWIQLHIQLVLRRRRTCDLCSTAWIGMYCMKSSDNSGITITSRSFDEMENAWADIDSVWKCIFVEVPRAGDVCESNLARSGFEEAIDADVDVMPATGDTRKENVSLRMIINLNILVWTLFTDLQSEILHVLDIYSWWWSWRQSLQIFADEEIGLWCCCRLYNGIIAHCSSLQWIWRRPGPSGWMKNVGPNQQLLGEVAVIHRNFFRHRIKDSPFKSVEETVDG